MLIEIGYRQWVDPAAVVAIRALPESPGCGPDRIAISARVLVEYGQGRTIMIDCPDDQAAAVLAADIELRVRMGRLGKQTGSSVE